MAKLKFNIELSCEIEIDEAVIASVDDEWRNRFYNLTTPEEVAEHLAYNLLVNGAKLSSLDGFADKHDEDASISTFEVDVSASQIK